MAVKQTISTLLKDGFILVFNQEKLDVVKVAQCLLDAGINNMEVTCRISKPLEKVARLKKELPNFVVGIASLIDYPAILDIYNKNHSSDPLPTLRQAFDGGADYLVSAANFRRESFDEFAGKAIMIPGCCSVTEIVDQFDKGANLCKLFPADKLGGVEFIKAIEPAIHKTISIAPMGGVNIDNIPAYLAAEVLVLGGSFSIFGSSLLKRIIDEQNYVLLAAELKKIKILIDECRTKKWFAIKFSSDGVEKIQSATGRLFNIK